MAVKLALNSKEDYNLDQEVCRNTITRLSCFYFLASLYPTLFIFCLEFFILQGFVGAQILKTEMQFKNSTACTLVAPCVVVCAWEWLYCCDKKYEFSWWLWSIMLYLWHILYDTNRYEYFPYSSPELQMHKLALPLKWHSILLKNHWCK